MAMQEVVIASAGAIHELRAVTGELQRIETLDLLGFLFFPTLAYCIYREGRRPFARRAVPAVMRSYQVNLANFFGNDLLLWLLSVPTLYLAADSVAGIGLLSGMAEGPLKWLLCFLLLDFTMYAWHYLMHHDDGMWVFHRRHHSDSELNVTTGLRYHPGELVLEVIVRSAFIVVVGVGAETVLACQGLISLFVLLHHTNTVLPGERWLAWVFIVPRLHRVHHSVRRDEHDSNYGAVFSIWDRLFGTLKEQEPTAIGLAGGGDWDFEGWLTAWLIGRLTADKRPRLIPIPVPRFTARSH